MKKTALAIALGTVFVAPAVEAQIVFGNDKIGTMQIYGRLYPQLQRAEVTGATGVGETVATLAGAPTGVNQGAHLGLQTQNSRIGFRGERRLAAGGLKAIWQLEQKISFEDPENVAGGSGVSGNDVVWATRNSFLGLSGGFGTVKLGHMDTIYKEYGDKLNFFGVKSGNFVSGSNVLSHIGIGTNNNARFHERAPNSIQYETPSFGAITAGIQYQPDERWGNPAMTRNRRLLSTGIRYDGKPLYLALAHERHADWFGGSSNAPAALGNLTDTRAKSRDTATRASAGYQIGSHQLTFDMAWLKWEEDPSGALAGPRFKSYKKTAWALGWEARVGGPWRAAAQYVRAGDGTCQLTLNAACSTEELASWMLSGGLSYDLDRQARLYTLISRLSNGKSAAYDNSSLLAPARGGDITQAAVGLSYSF